MGLKVIHSKHTKKQDEEGVTSSRFLLLTPYVLHTTAPLRYKNSNLNPDSFDASCDLTVQSFSNITLCNLTRIYHIVFFNRLFIINTAEKKNPVTSP